jgi:4-amino-4-deoxy-L-arabinose transferase-like glycosyltransferase
LHVVERLLDRFGWVFFGVFALVCAASLVVRARAKPFWHDEIYTILHAGLPSVGAMWQAAVDGIDLSPPLNTWLTRLVHSGFGVGHVATRIPPMAAYLVMTATVFQLLRTRANTATALAGAMLPAFTAAFRYSYEARAYSMMVALFALSLYAWSEAARGRHRPWHLSLLAATLAASVWNHYYGILTFVPVVAGELVRIVRSRRIDAGVAAAVGVSVLAVLPIYPLAAAARTQSQSFWSPASMSELDDVYRFLFAPLTEAPVPLAAIAVVALCTIRRRSRGATGSARSVPPHEVAAGLLALLIPVMGIALGLTVTGVFVARYAMAAVVGLSLVVPLAVWQRNTRGGIAELFLCGFLAATFAVSIRPSLTSPPVFQDPFLSRPVLRQAVTTESSTVSSSSLQFLQYWYYTPPAYKGRLRYLADPEEARKHMRSDTIDRGYLSLRRWTAVPIEPYADYLAGHPEFRVHEAGSGWLLRTLEANGAVREELAKGPGERLYLVRMPLDKLRAGPAR